MTTSKEIAISANANPVVVREIISELKSLEIVEAKEGRSGGISLAIDPAKITLGRIYRSLLSAPSATRRDVNPVCQISRSLPEFFEGLEAEVDDAVQEKLDRMTLADALDSIDF